MMNIDTVAIIVTFNRKALLLRCLQAVANQTQMPQRILIVDNASTDGTREMLAAEGWLNRVDIELLALEQNTGGAGGFYAGLQKAIEEGAEWVWMMDDDAEPHLNALEKLMEVAVCTTNIYGSLAVCNNETSWLMTLHGPPPVSTCIAKDIPLQGEVKMLPFLGFLVHRDLVAKIGFPDPAFFIAADDVEYCMRAQKIGAKIIVAGKSYIEHPKSRPYTINVLGRTLTCLALPPWKRYYDTRNRLLIARKYYGIRLLTQTIPGSVVRLCAALIKEPSKLAQARAFFAGMWDGLLGIKGKRHEKWGIKP